MSNAILGGVEYPGWHPVAAPKRTRASSVLRHVCQPRADVSSAPEYQMAGGANIKGTEDHPCW